METKRTESNSTSEKRVTETDWHADFRQPTERRTLNASNVQEHREGWIYNARGQVLTRTDTDPATSATRTWTYTYCEQTDVDTPGSTCPILGYRKTTDGPRTDVTDVATFAYHPATDESGCDTGGACHRRGDLWKITNALGQITEHVRYDRAGRVTRSKDANGALTDFAYHPRGWLTQRTVRARADGVPDAGDAVTTFDYAPTGLVERITQPDGDYIDYTYDGAHRLVGIADALGNHVTYTLDPAGNRIAEETFDPSNALRRRLAREYNMLGRLVKDRDALIDALNPNGRLVAEHGYDGNGNRTHTLDGLGRRTDHEYDPLNRLKKTLDALGPRGITEYAYDARDNLIQVKDPKGLITEYVYDGLNNLRELRSPDTGTAVYLYDAAGNRTRQTDARGVVTDYAYDALNRLTAISYPSDPDLDIAFVYDQAEAECGTGETYAVGRLNRVVDGAGTTYLCYDKRGNLMRKVIDDGFSKTLTTRYRYTLADRLAGTIYPSGREIDVQRDAAGRISGLRRWDKESSSWQPLLSTVQYRPFGPLAGFAFGNGRTVSKAYDPNYAIDALASSAADGLNLDFEVDVLGNITAITPTGTGTGEDERSYAYDPLYRLSEVRDANNALIEAFTYDATGNRLSKLVGAGTEVYSYPAGSHRLDAIDTIDRDYDANGNLTAILSGLAHPDYAYGAHNRLDSFSYNGLEQARYAYNGQGERVCKWLGTDAIRYVYDAGGRLLGEYTAAGTAIAEYVYLDTLPVAVFTAAGVAYIETDHLGTPRVVVDAGTNQAIWHWPLTGSAFGEHAPNQDPDGNSVPYTFNLRFPGQYYDTESSLHYNYFRDYEPSVGRYIEADPIGLNGGINVYAYVRGNPLALLDPTGLCYGPGMLFGVALGTCQPPRFPPAPSYPADPSPSPSAAHCNGRWWRVRWHKESFPGISMIQGRTPTCICYWLCRSCYEADAFGDPPTGTQMTTGPMYFSSAAGSSFDPEQGDACLCAKPGNERGCTYCPK